MLTHYLVNKGCHFARDSDPGGTCNALLRRYLNRSGRLIDIIFTYHGIGQSMRISSRSTSDDCVISKLQELAYTWRITEAEYICVSFDHSLVSYFSLSHCSRTLAGANVLSTSLKGRFLCPVVDSGLVCHSFTQLSPTLPIPRLVACTQSSVLTNQSPLCLRVTWPQMQTFLVSPRFLCQCVAWLLQIQHSEYF